MGREKSRGFRLDLGEELDGKLADFCAAYYNGSKTQVIREAVNEHINSVLANEPERRRRYEAERRKRVGAAVRPIKLVKPVEEG